MANNGIKFVFIFSLFFIELNSAEIKINVESTDFASSQPKGLRYQRQTQPCSSGTCRPECGLLPRNDSPKNLPWQALIYMKQPENLPTVICRGSLVSAKVVISVAHCFWNPSSSAPKDKDQFAVGLGKVHKEWMDARDVNAKYSDVENLILPPTFAGDKGNYAHDIAIVFLVESIQFTANINPVCVDWNHQGTVQEMAAGTEGKLDGCDSTSQRGDAKEVAARTLSRSQCLENSPVHFEPFITADKFCAEFMNGSNICPGLSGAGLSFPKDYQRKSVYYLAGIISVAPRDYSGSDFYQFAAFTTVLEYLNFLKDHEVHLHQNQSAYVYQDGSL